MSNSFRFKKGDLEIEFSGEQSFVEKQIENWKNFLTGKSLSEPENNLNNNSEDTGSSIPVLTVKKNISIEEFLKLKKPDNDTDKTLMAAYYLEKYDKYENFTELDLYRIVSIEDITRYLNINLEKGFLVVCNCKNQLNSYTLTFSGEKYVKDGLYIR